MKIKILTLMSLLIFASSNLVFAAPTAMSVKPSAKSEDQKAYNQTLKSLAVEEIKDPAAREAIEAIRNYLDPTEQIERERKAAKQHINANKELTRQLKAKAV